MMDVMTSVKRRTDHEKDSDVTKYTGSVKNIYNNETFIQTYIGDDNKHKKK